jgi:hypothetical protein
MCCEWKMCYGCQECVLWSVVRIPPSLRGSVDFCSFGKVFSHGPRCWACGNHRGHHITLFGLVKTPLE